MYEGVESMVLGMTMGWVQDGLSHPSPVQFIQNNSHPFFIKKLNRMGRKGYANFPYLFHLDLLNFFMIFF